jgi:IS1 family transposase
MFDAGIIPVTNMNKLSEEKQTLILSHLVEGNSIRSIERITGVHRDTIMRLLVRAGDQANIILDQRCRNLKSNFVQCDEIWAFVGKKQKQARTEEDKQKGYGDQYIFVALDAETKLVPVFVVGKRSMENADYIMKQLSERIPKRFQLSTDAFPAYRLSVYKYLGGDVDYGQVIKSYGGNNGDRSSEARYSPPKILSVTIRPVMGQPYVKMISTSYIERQNLTIRMQNRRLTRLTNAFSKKVENLKAAMALHFFHYNFMRPHSTLNGATPAMASGISQSFWSWQQFLSEERTYRVAA